ncbi:Verru_Chthon cassette protein D [Variovorax sp. SRS16]|uniref:GspH/FimT family pseudopilin n=1 Tax=Variovorax sp. SRS16 TaxID=282217 RepID=UPI0013171911|nr:GspH/FimT family pseudopilin [Variovorax sp. SRS16]VTU33978.1 Verru_Chthon cassette protein D [Variovorax sp. SRS16]
MRQRGFTLVELIVTITVLAMILAMAMPTVANWTGNTRIRNVADSLQNGLQIARAEAVRRNQSMSFWLVAVGDPTTLSNDCTLSSTSGSWVVSINSPVGHCADAPSTTSSPMLVTGRASGGGITVAAFQADNATAGMAVTFDGFGRIAPTAGAGTIGFINVTGATGSVNLSIVVSPGGLVRMCDPRVTDTKDPRLCVPPSP